MPCWLMILGRFEMIDTPNTRKVLEKLRKYTDKKILIKHMDEFHHPAFSGPVSYLGIVDDTPECIIIFLSERCPEETFIHEILHKILHYEGFPVVFINERFARSNLPQNMIRALPKLQGYFSSTIDHPEVFRRMETDYTLDLNKYYEIQVNQKLNRFKKILKNNNPEDIGYFFYRQQDILIGLDYFLFGNCKEKIIEVFKQHFPDAYQSCMSLYKKTSKVGFSTPQSAYKSAQLIKKHIINYGERKSIYKEFNDIWKALEIRLK